MDAEDKTVVKVSVPKTSSMQNGTVTKPIIEDKPGKISSETPMLPRITRDKSGSIFTQIFKNPLAGLFEEKFDEATGPPKPYVKGLNSSGGLTVGFDQKMAVPDNIDEINNAEVALRWMQSRVRTETYLTPEGYRDFEIRPAVDVQIQPSLDSDLSNPSFDYKITDFTETEMKIQVNFDQPELISTTGISTDNIRVTFWSNEFLKGQNGLSMEEGQTIQKGIIPQVEPKIANEV